MIGGAAIFAFLSSLVDPNSTSRIAAQIVTGVGFLGAGIILKSESEKRITNLTTAAAIWYAAALGVAIGFEYYFLAAVATAFAVGVPRIPHITRLIKKVMRNKIYQGCSTTRKRVAIKGKKWSVLDWQHWKCARGVITP